jgi:hypothetical protein
MHGPVDAHSPIPIRRQLTEPRTHVIEGGSAPRNQALPSPRELVGFLDINPNTREQAIEDLERSGYRPLLPLTVDSALVHPEGAPGPRAQRGRPCVVKGFRQRVGKAPWADQEGVSARGAPRRRAGIGL